MHDQVEIPPEVLVNETNAIRHVRLWRTTHFLVSGVSVLVLSLLFLFFGISGPLPNEPWEVNVIVFGIVPSVALVVFLWTVMKWRRLKKFGVVVRGYVVRSAMLPVHRCQIFVEYQLNAETIRHHFSMPPHFRGLMKEDGSILMLVDLKTPKRSKPLYFVAYNHQQRVELLYCYTKDWIAATMPNKYFRA